MRARFACPRGDRRNTRRLPRYPLPCATVRRIVIAAVVIVAAAGVAAYWLLGRDSGEDVAAFFTLPTPTVCESGALAISASNGHFAAFAEGRELAESGDKFLIADISVRNDGSVVAPVSENSFYLTEHPGQRHQAAVLKAGAASLSANLGPGGTASARLAFSVPASVGAAKLVYDDGCAHQEWLVP